MNGRTTFISAASRNIGAAISRAFAEAGLAAHIRLPPAAELARVRA